MDIQVSTTDTRVGKITLVKIVNASGASVTLSNLGAGIVEVCVPDSQGRLANVALGYADPADYMADGPCMGKTPGRYANRIARGRFSIDGTEYQLAVNNGPNALHGGPTGFQNRLWNVRIDSARGEVVFSRVSPDGEEGYPGTLTAEVIYRWTDDNILSIDYNATVEGAPTVVNLTNHTYWNLDRTPSALDHTLRLNADRYVVTDKDLTPTGELAPVDSTPMDFRTERRIGDDVAKTDFAPLAYGKGYDSCWEIAGSPGALNEAATLAGPQSGRVLKVRTTHPGVQVYSGNWLKGSPKGVDGQDYDDYAGIAIECQHFPDAPNHPHFASTLLRPGETMHERIEYHFTAL